ncbi:hypothetical protein H5V45_14650 [Nocardioides sp. KIGAM211]|uniref:Uncharacterized protein n=1 Tax=Nocardioides luti TaxID=2761101 RepID=A0A7X0RI35_9ACTN|nr:hypothetical protein [Nocardioides luti]MBB6628562.1 hypothetical protein [Nocardioides luti]
MRWWRRRPSDATASGELRPGPGPDRLWVRPGVPEEELAGAEIVGHVVEMERLHRMRARHVPLNHGLLDGADPWWVLRDGVWSYRAFERGQEVWGRTTTSRHELVGWAVADVARSLAVSAERADQGSGATPDRSRVHGRWEHIVRLRDPRWGDEVAARIAAEVARWPYGA